MIRYFFRFVSKIFRTYHNFYYATNKNSHDIIYDPQTIWDSGSDT